MSNMENLDAQLSEKERQDAAYAGAIEKMRSENTRAEARGYAVMAAALGYGEGALGAGTFGKVSHFAKLFCILFAMLVPSLLLWRVVF